MIPSFIATIIDTLVGPLGFDVMVQRRSDHRWTVERISVMRRPAGLPRPTRLAPYRGDPLTPAADDGR